MAAIDIGGGATDRDNYFADGYTLLDKTNPANLTGILTAFEFWANTDISDLKVGTFSGTGDSYDDRDFETIGSVTSGSKQTFTGKSCSVEAGDLLGVFYSSGVLECSSSGGAGLFYKSLDRFGKSAYTYLSSSKGPLSMYATGAEDGSATIGFIKNIMSHHFIPNLIGG